MTNDSSDVLLNEILMTPSNEMRSTEENNAAPCNGQCTSGMCRTA